jgi:hypothetical protein
MGETSFFSLVFFSNCFFFFFVQLSIEPVEGDSQSFQSVTLDTSRHREMVDLVERQRSQANRLKDRSHKSLQESGSHYDLHNQTIPVLERQATTNTEGVLSDITFESDDGLGSDRTTTACTNRFLFIRLLFFYLLFSLSSHSSPSLSSSSSVYMTDRGSPSKDNNGKPVDLRQMSDEQIVYLESLIRSEKYRRKVQPPAEHSFPTTDAQAIEIRKGLRRSKSGGSEAAFSRKQQGTTTLDRKASENDLNSSFGSMRVSQTTLGEGEPEDPEVRSAFSTQLIHDHPHPPPPATHSSSSSSAHHHHHHNNNNSNNTTTTTPSSSAAVTNNSTPAATPSKSPSYAVRALSRGSGAIHPGDKMFERYSAILNNGSTPSPATTTAAGSSHASTAIHFLNSPTQYIQSPIQGEWAAHSRPNSRPNSRPSTEVIHSLDSSSHNNSHNNSFRTMESLHLPATTSSSLAAATTPAPSVKKGVLHENNNNNNNIIEEEQPQQQSLSVASPPSLLLPPTHGHGHGHGHLKGKKQTNTALGRELVLSPSCAFDDISLGSQKSLNSSRSSRTRVIGEIGPELPSPTSNFSKHHNNFAVATGFAKKAVQTVSSTNNNSNGNNNSSEIKKSSRKN